jgi:hypothetical protein
VAGVDENMCREHLRRISAILNYHHGTTDPVCLMHLSFTDFISDPARCSELSHYVVNTAEDHLRMTECCLQIMNRHLRHDICDLRDPSLFNSEISDLTALVEAHVLGCLRYSCRYWIIHWIHHIRAAGSQAQTPPSLDRFCGEHLFHWIEVLALTEDMNAVRRVMPELISVMKVRFSY